MDLRKLSAAQIRKLAPEDLSCYNTGVFKYLKLSGYNINKRYGTHKYSLMHLYALKGAANHIKRLLEMGANPNIKDSLKLTPLELAIQTYRHFSECEGTTFRKNKIKKVIKVLLPYSK